tara:strand:- start:17955 stop:18272 length:318 start_codon:yes stop_codon:yes gene_type:complete
MTPEPLAKRVAGQQRVGEPAVRDRQTLRSPIAPDHKKTASKNGAVIKRLTTIQVAKPGQRFCANRVSLKRCGPFGQFKTAWREDAARILKYLLMTRALAQDIIAP